MNRPPFFRTLMQTPPNGEWFYEVNGERVADPSWVRFFPKAIALMRKHHVKGAPRDVIAAHMCPHMPEWFCTSGGLRVTSTHTARTNATPYFSKHLVPYNEIISRLEVCRACPKHSRHLCLTCTGILDWITASFGTRRTRLPDDRMSGVCMCADTFESVIASVDAKELPEWNDVPEGCWRNKK